jgi:hypothetical protein
MAHTAEMAEMGLVDFTVEKAVMDNEGQMVPICALPFVRFSHHSIQTKH